MNNLFVKYVFPNVNLILSSYDLTVIIAHVSIANP